METGRAALLTLALATIPACQVVWPGWSEWCERNPCATRCLPTGVKPADDASPNQVEVCNGLDDDCDGRVDEDPVDALEVYADDDGDGVGAGPVVRHCELTEGWSTVAGDCDDGDAGVAPGQIEVCNGKDDDCDEVVDWGFGVPSEFGSIQAAVDAAPDGETICVDPGVYLETLDLGQRDIAVVGWAGSEQTFLDGQAVPDRAVVTAMFAARAHLEGFSITGGASEAVPGLLVDGSVLSLTDVEVSSNVCTSSTACGPTIRFEDSEVELRDVVVVDNAIDVTAVGSATLEAVVVFDQTTGSWTGGGVYSNEIQLSTTDAVDSYTEASVFSPLHIGGGDVELVGVAVADNNISVSSVNAVPVGASKVLVHGAGLSVANASFTATDLVVERNAVSTYNQDDRVYWQWVTDVGGAVGLDNTDVVWTGGAIRDQVVDLQGDEAIASAVASAVYGSVELTDVEVTGNRLTVTGPDSNCYGMRLNASFADTTRLDVRGNEVRCTGSTSSATALFWVFFPVGDTRFENAVIAGNRLESSGATDALLAVYGGWGTAVELSFATVTGNVIEADTFRSAVFWIELDSMLSVDNSTVDGNFAVAASPADSSHPQARLLGSADAPGYNTWSIGHSNVFGNDGVEDIVENGVVSQLAGPCLVSSTADYVDVAPIDVDQWDLHLAPGSRLIDAGDPAVLDGDGSRADIGAYGGPGGGW